MKWNQITIKNIFYYIQGNIRYRLYYSKYKHLISEHILEQIDARIKSMRRTCYNNGSCDECGCATTALQMCNKACEGNCYPAMLSKYKWWQTKTYGITPNYDFKFINGKFVKNI